MASTSSVDPNGSPAAFGIDFPAVQRSEQFQRLRKTHRSFVFPMAVAFLVVDGQAAHAGNPADGRNAIHGAALVVAAMERWHDDLAAAPPVLDGSGTVDVTAYTDPVPQALVLTAIVISFATTALLLVVLIVSRGLTGTDHVDGREDG